MAGKAVTDPVDFDWNKASVRHLSRHGVSPQEAEQCYRNDPLVIEGQDVNGEERNLALGETDGGRRLTLVFTIRFDKVRFVTAYAMTKEQQAIYEEG